MLWIIIIGIIIVLDQITKVLITKNVEINGLITVINKFFYITHVQNKGAAWSILENKRYFFIVITVIISILIAYYLLKSKDRFLKLSFSFILGGALGNLIDRIIKGSVTDFFEFHFGSYIFPIFNVADIFVVIGTFLLAAYVLFISKE